MENKKNAKYNNKRSNNYRANYNNRKPRVSNYNRKIEVLDDDYSLTQQQQFDFGGELDSIENLDVSFVEEKERKIARKKLAAADNKVVDEPKKNIGVVFLVMILLLMIILLCYLFVKYNDLKKVKAREKVVTKTVEEKVVDDNYLFLGDSITDFYDLDKYYEDLPVVNSGINGNRTTDILNDMKDRVYRYNPSKVFLLIGTNDIIDGKGNDEIIDNIKKIIELIKKNRPYAEIYLESIYPVNKTDNDKISLSMVSSRDNDQIIEINKKLKKYCDEKKITYIDLYSKLVDDEGNLKLDYTKEGLHLSDDGYKVVTEEISKYIKK